MIEHVLQAPAQRGTQFVCGDIGFVHLMDLVAAVVERERGRHSVQLVRSNPFGERQQITLRLGADGVEAG